MLYTMLAALVAAEVVLASGGNLAGPPPPDKAVAREGAEVAAYAFAEVPGNARLQAALAAADSGARAELVKYVRVKVSESYKEHDEDAIERRTREVAKAMLPAMGVPRRGWRKVERDGEVYLQVWSRICVDAAKLAELTK